MPRIYSIINNLIVYFYFTSTSPRIWNDVNETIDSCTHGSENVIKTLEILNFKFVSEILSFNNISKILAINSLSYRE